MAELLGMVDLQRRDKLAVRCRIQDKLKEHRKLGMCLLDRRLSDMWLLDK